MKKPLLWLLIMLLTVSMIATFSLAGCKKEAAPVEEEVVEEAAPAEEEAAPAEEEVSYEGRVLTIAASQNWVKEDVEQELIDDFTAETGVIVDLQVNPDDQYPNIIKTKLATGEGPDIFFFHSGITLKQIPAENVFDLSNEPWVPRLKDWARAGATIDGKLWALNIWSVDGWAMLYNTAIFEEYNLTPPEDYAGFLEICETLKSNGINPIYEWPSDLWHTPMYMNEAAAIVNYNNPGTYDKLNSGELKFVDIPEFELGLTQLKELADLGYLGEDYMSGLWSEAINAMGTGESAMELVYTSFQSEVVAGYPESGAENWKMFPSPLGFTEGVDVFGTSAGGVVMLVNKDTENLDLVRLWFDFRTRVENLEKFYAGKPSLGNPSFADVEKEPTAGLASITELVDGNFQMDAQGGVLFFDQMVVGKYIEEMLVGTSTPVQVLEKIDADRAALMEIAE